MLVHALSLLVNQRLLEDIDRFSHEAELIVLPPPCPNNVAPSDFSQAERLIEAGYRLAAEALDDPDPAGSVTPRAIERLRPHQHG
jgi:NTE family protein